MAWGHRVVFDAPTSWSGGDQRRLFPYASLSDRLCRIIDIALCIPLLIFILPLMVFVGLACWAQDGGPALYAQQRIGRDGVMFPCFKFRSMVVDSDRRLQELLRHDKRAAAEWAASQKLTRDPRITPWGRFIRKTSLDELPQLFNVLRGEMSLVGPRPIVMAEAVRYGSFLRDYQSVRPGITGLWQVSGRADTSYRRRVAIDVLYTRRRSVVLYVKILAATVPCVLLSRGAY